MSASISTRSSRPEYKPVFSTGAQTQTQASHAQLPIGGLIPFSASDWPDHLTMTLFLNGCPLRCSYCHNPQLQAFGPGSYIWQEALSLLCSRRGLLDGVVFSGGEPLSAPGLPQAIASAHAAGFKVGLHTSGYLPSRLDKLMAHPETRPEWIGIDRQSPAGRPATGHRLQPRPSTADVGVLLSFGRLCAGRTTIAASPNHVVARVVHRGTASRAGRTRCATGT